MRPSTLISLSGGQLGLSWGGCPAVMQVGDLTVLDGAEHHAFAVRRSSWIGLRPGIRRKPAQHAPIDVEKIRCPCSLFTVRRTATRRPSGESAGSIEFSVSQR